MKDEKIKSSPADSAFGGPCCSNDRAGCCSTLTRRASEGCCLPRWRVGLRCCRITHADFVPTLAGDPYMIPRPWLRKLFGFSFGRHTIKRKGRWARPQMEVLE